MEVKEIAAKFDIKGGITDVRPLGNGHINSTFLVVTDREKYTFQRINTAIFSDPDALMENLFAVTGYLKEHYPDDKTLDFIRTKNGDTFYRDGDGCYRMWVFIDGAVALDQARDERDLYESAVAFGSFQRKLADFPAGTLHEIIKDFHNTARRYDNLKAAVENDVCGRLASAKSEAERYLARRDMIETGVTLPLRVTHNDTKLNNVLLDKDTGKGICVIDLDTIMPGLSINDFGDSIRFGASTAAEDERELDKVHFSLELFEAYTRGYFDGVGGALTDDEVRLLPHGAWAMTYECGMRFLTDYLEGDVYFKTAYPEHNLVRARTQLRLCEEMERQMDEMKRIVEKYKK